MKKRIFAVILCFAMIFGTFSYIGFGNNGIANAAINQSVKNTESEIPECDCNNGDKALIDHVATCAQRYYIQSTYVIGDDGNVVDKSAADIYAEWDSMDKTIQQGILDLMQEAIDEASDQDTKNKLTDKLAELNELISGSSGGGETGDKETTKEDKVGNTTITATGDFSNASKVKMTVKKVKEENYSHNFKVFLNTDKNVSKSDIKFAFDITFVDKDNAEWQPADGKNVSVTIDAKSLGLNNGDVIGIIHEHDGTIEKNAVAHTVKNGKITFQTDSFSTFYGYTVDFNYSDGWYSISGGSDIYLYELFAQMGIDKSTKDVKNVEFSNPDLVTISKRVVNGYTGEKDWHIQSLKPFSTEETLTVTMKEGKGEPIVINVYDEAYSGTLSGNINLNDGDVINGASVSGSANLKLNGTVTVNGTINVPQGAVLSITGAGTLKRGDSFTSRMFDVKPGGTLNITGTANGDNNSIIIDGNAEWTSKPVSDSTREILTVTRGSGVTSAAIYIDSKTANDSTGNAKVNLSNTTLQNLYTGSEKDLVTTSKQAPVINTTGDSVSDKPNTDNHYAEITMNHVTVRKCATKSDNAILLFNDSIANMEKCKILKNYSGNRYAGAIKAGGPHYFSQLTMNDCYASENYSSGWGGVILWAANSGTSGGKSAKATITNCIFENNKARYLGGALSNEAIMEVSGTEIKENTAMAGGGIATFPFTRTEISGEGGGGNACGLTLGAGNRISDNHAVATGTFTPFSIKDDAGKNPNGDDEAAWLAEANQITYTGGGGGIWCYMNKDKWSCSLDIGVGNTLTNNITKNRGGGVYVDNVCSEGTVGRNNTKLTVSGADISKNEALNGGGIAVNNTNLTIESGSISNNSASNGGGVYAIGGGTIEMKGNGDTADNGALIVGNKAIGTPENITTAYKDINLNDLKSVGGGIFIADGGKFKLTGTSVGIYSNTADFAADDVFANGKNTKLDVPDVKDMTLTGLQGVKPDGWFEDYANNDSGYNYGLQGNTNPEIAIKRYKLAAVDEIANNVFRVSVDEANKNSKYVCMTLGLKHGSLTIKKNAAAGTTIDENQYFVFEVKNADNSTPELNMIVTVKADGSTTIRDLPHGRYTVKELTDWSWRYDSTEVKYKEIDNIVSVTDKKATAIINDVNPTVTVDVTNTKGTPWWLTDQFGVKNISGVSKSEAESR